MERCPAEENGNDAGGGTATVTPSKTTGGPPGTMHRPQQQKSAVANSTSLRWTWTAVFSRTKRTAPSLWYICRGNDSRSPTASCLRRADRNGAVCADGEILVAQYDFRDSLRVSKSQGRADTGHILVLGAQPAWKGLDPVGLPHLRPTFHRPVTAGFHGAAFFPLHRAGAETGSGLTLPGSPRPGGKPPI